MSDETPNYPAPIAKAIIAIKKQVKQLGSDERNPHGGYAYVSVDKFYDRIGKLMAEAGLALLIDETDSEVREGGGSGKPWLFVRYSLAFMHETGAVSAPLHRSLALPITGPQTYGAAQSYIEKQFLRQVFKIPTGEKDADEVAPDDTSPGKKRGQPAAEQTRLSRTTLTSPGKAATDDAPRTTAPAPKGEPHVIPLLNRDWIGWGGRLVARLQESQTRREAEQWIAKNKGLLFLDDSEPPQIDCCERDMPRLFDRVCAQIDAARTRLPDFMQPGDER